MHALHSIFAANKAGSQQGIYSVCSAHPLVLKAALLQAKQDQSRLLIEATANQVNQFGGYTGMMPADFIAFVKQLATEVGFNPEQLVFGGDHLGPVCWQDLPAAEAMLQAEALIAAFVAAGFTKIHLDTSMRCADDPAVLSDQLIASRAARLCQVAEESAARENLAGTLSYVIGTEVPPPGGVSELEQGIVPTSVDSVQATLLAHRQAFAQQGLSAEVWSRVIAVVVQPGVEFDNTRVHAFDAEKAKALSAFIAAEPGLVFEAHSTDYQTEAAYHALVQGHFAILKVGPQLTFALREALFALAQLEQQLLPAAECSQLQSKCLELMLAKPGYWHKFYQAEGAKLLELQLYSYSDRIRYYWPEPVLQQAQIRLFDNIRQLAVSQPVLHQFLPQHAQPESAGDMVADPEQLVIRHIQLVLARYASACGLRCKQEQSS
ncbi:D-tagatose-bisphosphate aldolase, class II, non-catalytic subunit [Alkalimonas sp.]|uniref:D-tagatose-bisphosphate aldolase, class II, non-catalytic subunit n=1 Tax=Alkalimonas sp. TaxID=1872453 RepID=UPI00263AEEBB|nr:D-tagatose-bisphosphate aldolase, class II, non-catalytic subunit [Alkalimonas sp.]MCC5826292.1 D-tagatose-bisphosphate aldolase, class II, non-catalytic subunit [Alkalimonas sp.]